jgi:bacteriorhodopsin
MSEKGMKKVISILMDVLFAAVIVFAVYLLTVNNFISVNENVLYAVIILLIPLGFYMTYMSFAKEIDWNKLPGDEEAENEPENETEQGNVSGEIESKEAE